MPTFKYKVTLYKVESTHDRVRTDTIEGSCSKLPNIGHPFVMFAEPLEAKFDYRWFCSTRVTNCSFASEEDTYLFKTKNSTYRLKVHTRM